MEDQPWRKGTAESVDMITKLVRLYPASFIFPIQFLSSFINEEICQGKIIYLGKYIYYQAIPAI